jgi:HEAT repeat protein
MSDELERLANVYHVRATASAKSRIDVLLDLERIRDPRVVPFLLQVLKDGHESAEVRMHVVKQLRNGGGLLVPADRPPVAKAIGEVLVDASSEELRLQAALALGDFTQIDGVLSRLTAVAVARHESIDLRYAAFTSIERAGPTPEGIAHLQQLARDETLGGAARSVLSAWHVG